jgi:VanZ family protein
MTFSPIFIIGVPRSGTTLLRVLLDSHSRILALPETPWLSGAYGEQVSLRHLVQDVADGPYGAARNVAGVERGHAFAAGAAFLEYLFKPALEARGKSVVAFKTPSDIPYLDFLVDLLPDAFYIHITRDGRDVAMSQLAKKGSFFLDLRGYRGLSYANVFRRWVEWETRARDILRRPGLNVLHMRYEDLIAQPEREMRRLLASIGLPFEPAMLDYAQKEHDYPVWEAGSTDVARQGGLSASSIGKWRGQAPSAEMLHTLMRYDSFLVDLGYPTSGLRPGPVQRLRMAGYAIVQPAIEALYPLQRRLRPVVRSPARVVACLCLLLLVLQFLAPAQMVGVWPTDTQSRLITFIAAFGTGAFIPALQRRSGGQLPLVMLRVWLAMTIFLGLLEIGQMAAPGRHATPQDFLLNAAAALLGLLAAMPVLMRTQRTRPA